MALPQKGIVQIIGVGDVIAALRKKQKKYYFGLAEGLKIAGLFIQRESQLIVPVDLNNLRPSADTKHSGSGISIVVRVFYTASYAVYVHEDLEARHSPGQEAKFLEKPIRENTDKILKIVLNTAKQYK